LEYLPDSIETFYLLTGEDSESKAEVIEKELKKYGEPEDDNFVGVLLT
jgi:hypothetical protein